MRITKHAAVQRALFQLRQGGYTNADAVYLKLVAELARLEKSNTKSMFRMNNPNTQ